MLATVHWALAACLLAVGGYCGYLVGEMPADGLRADLRTSEFKRAQLASVLEAERATIAMLTDDGRARAERVAAEKKAAEDRATKTEKILAELRTYADRAALQSTGRGTSREHAPAADCRPVADLLDHYDRLRDPAARASADASSGAAVLAHRPAAGGDTR